MQTYRPVLRICAMLTTFLLATCTLYANLAHADSDRTTRDTRLVHDRICERGSRMAVGLPSCQVDVQIVASLISVVAGEPSLLMWTSTNADSCVASGGWSGSKATSGSQLVSPVAPVTTYTLTCSGPTGSKDASVSITLIPGLLN